MGNFGRGHLKVRIIKKSERPMKIQFYIYLEPDDGV